MPMCLGAYGGEVPRRGWMGGGVHDCVGAAWLMVGC